MNILVVSQWFPPEPGGGPARFYEMGRAWAEAGHRVSVLSGIPNWPTGVTHLRYRGRGHVRERLDGIDVLRTWVYPARNEGRTKRVLNHASFLGSAPFSAFVSGCPADVVVATSPPLFAAVAGLAVAKMRNVPFVFDVRDLWPDAIFALGQMQSPLLRRTLEGLESYLYRNASTVISVSEAFVEKIRTRGARRVQTIPNGADLATFQAGPANSELRKELGWDNRFVVMYAGTLGASHGLLAVLEAAEMYPTAHFVLVGEGADRQLILSKLNRKRLPNVQVLPLQPRERMPALYRAADACLVMLRPIELFDSFIPSKIFEIMASGRPIIASVGGKALEIVLEAEAGIPVVQGSPESLTDAVALLQKDPLSASRMGKSGREYVEQHYDRSRLASRYLETLLMTAGVTR